MSPAGGRHWRLVRAGSDAVPASVRRFMARARRRRMRTAVPWALTAAVTAVVVLVAWTLWSSTLLSVREVRVTGVEILSPVQVQQAAAVPERLPLMRVDLGAVAGQVAALAPVAEVKVHRAWPHTLAIQVVERTAVAVAPVGDRFGLVDGAGVVFHPVATPPPGLPVLVVPAAGPTDPATVAALTVLAALTGPLRGEVDTVTVAGLAGIRLGLRDGREIVWGDESQSELKARVATALLSSDQNIINGTIIDVSAPDVVSFE